MDRIGDKLSYDEDIAGFESVRDIVTKSEQCPPLERSNYSITL